MVDFRNVCHVFHDKDLSWYPARFSENKGENRVYKLLLHCLKIVEVWFPQTGPKLENHFRIFMPYKSEDLNEHPHRHFSIVILIIKERQGYRLKTRYGFANIPV